VSSGTSPSHSLHHRTGGDDAFGTDHPISVKRWNERHDIAALVDRNDAFFPGNLAMIIY
jgi:hypothetical protein